MNGEQLTRNDRHRLASALRDQGWHGTAADIEDGFSPQAVLERLRDKGEGESTAALLVGEVIEP